MADPAHVLLVALSVFGGLNAVYFIAVERRWMRPDPRWLPPVCRMDEQTCARVVDTEYARVFGPSNAVLGLVWYLLVGLAGAIALAVGSVPQRTLLAVVAAATVVLAGYLVWALFARLRTVCPLCLVGHAINVGILVALLLA